jgi:predicted transcriptional regulator of viral defense system
MDVRLRELAARQADIVAAWQLLAAGWTRRMVFQQAKKRGWRMVHRGVYALTQAPLTRRQLWMAAALTGPRTVLSHASAGGCHGFRPYTGRFETVTRPGSGGSRRHGRLLISRSKTLDGDTTVLDGIPITTAERTILDLAPHLYAPAAGRMFREALRIGSTTSARLLRCLDRHPTRRGGPGLRDLAVRYASLPYDRTRSNAEARALECSTTPESSRRA